MESFDSKMERLDYYGPVLYSKVIEVLMAALQTKMAKFWRIVRNHKLGKQKKDKPLDKNVHTYAIMPTYFHDYIDVP